MKATPFTRFSNMLLRVHQNLPQSGVYAKGLDWSGLGLVRSGRAHWLSLSLGARPLSIGLPAGTPRPCNNLYRKISRSNVLKNFFFLYLLRIVRKNQIKWNLFIIFDAESLKKDERD